MREELIWHGTLKDYVRVPAWLLDRVRPVLLNSRDLSSEDPPFVFRSRLDGSDFL